MGISLGWDNPEKSIILGEIDWPYTWDDLTSAWKTAVEMIEGVPHPVYVIVLGKTSNFPSGNPLTNLQQVVKYIPGNLGMMIIVTENCFQTVINNMVFQMLPRLKRAGHVVPTLERAYTLIERETGIPGETP